MFLNCLRIHSLRRLPGLSVVGIVLFALLHSAAQASDTRPDPGDTPNGLATPATETANSIMLLVEQINILRAELDDQQSTLGVYDPGILASLNQLGEALISAGALSEAQTSIEQQIQIIRINDGLYSSAQVALVQQQLAILAAQGDWAGMQDRVQYLLWLFERTADLSVAEKLQGIKTVRDWSRLLLIRGPRDQESAYLLQLRSLEESALALALAHSSDINAETLQAFTYDQAISELYIALGIIGTSDTSRLLINSMEGLQNTPLRPGQRVTSVAELEAVYGARTSTVIDRSHRTAMNRHYKLISTLADLIDAQDSESLPLESTNPEAAAMMQLYLGDSILMRTQYELRIGTNTSPARGSNSTGIASRYYQRAWELFLESGYDADTLNGVFACPVLLPLAEFSIQLKPAEQRCQSTDAGQTLLPDAYALRNGVPGIRHTGLPENAVIPVAEGVSTTLKFNVGVNGQADRIQILAAEPDSMMSRIRARDSLVSLQFRPALENGRPVRSHDVEIILFTVDAN